MDSEGISSMTIVLNQIHPSSAVIKLTKCPWRKRNHEGAAGALWCGLSEFFDISGYDLKKIVEYLGASVCKVIFSNVFHILL